MFDNIRYRDYMIEKTLVLIKPDGVERALSGRVMGRFESAGLKIVALKMLKPDKERMGRHYPDDREWLTSMGAKTKASYLEKGKEVNETELEIGQRIRNQLINSLSGKPVIAMAVEGNDAIFIVRKLVGSTEPRTADPGSIRGSLSSDSYELADSSGRPIRNIIHASSSKPDAEKELAIWFEKHEIVEYTRADHNAQY